jgi:transposase
MLFEALILELVKVMPVHQVSQIMKTYDKKLWDMIKAYTEKARAEEDYSGMKVVGVDETAARRGHDYVTLFVDLEEKRTVFVTDGKDQQVVEEFVQDLIAHNGTGENITQVSCDMSPAFIKGVEDRLSDLLLTPDYISNENLVKEGTDPNRVKFVGNIMIDTLETNRVSATELLIKDIIYVNQGLKCLKSQ